MATWNAYKLKRSVLAIGNNGERVPVMIPEGAVVTLVEIPLNHSRRMLDVEWDGRTLTMFTQDLLERGVKEKLERASASAA